MRFGHTLRLSLAAAVATVATAVFASGAGAVRLCVPADPSPGDTATCTFSYTGAAETWVVPAGVTSATFELWGAQGGRVSLNAGGQGAHVQRNTRALPRTTAHANRGRQRGVRRDRGQAQGSEASAEEEPAAPCPWVWKTNYGGGGGGASYGEDDRHSAVRHRCAPDRRRRRRREQGGRSRTTAAPRRRLWKRGPEGRGPRGPGHGGGGGGSGTASAGGAGGAAGLSAPSAQATWRSAFPVRRAALRGRR